MFQLGKQTTPRETNSRITDSHFLEYLVGFSTADLSAKTTSRRERNFAHGLVVAQFTGESLCAATEPDLNRSHCALNPKGSRNGRVMADRLPHDVRTNDRGENANDILRNEHAAARRGRVSSGNERHAICVFGGGSLLNQSALPRSGRRRPATRSTVPVNLHLDFALGLRPTGKSGIPKSGTRTDEELIGATRQWNADNCVALSAMKTTQNTELERVTIWSPAARS